MCVAQVGQVARGACRAVRTARSVLPDAVAELRFNSGHVGIVRVVRLRPEAVAKRSCACCWKPTRLENRVPGDETAFLDGSLCSKPSVLGGGDLDDSSEAILRRSLRLLSTKVEALWRHQILPAEAETKKDEEVRRADSGIEESAAFVLPRGRGRTAVGLRGRLVAPPFCSGPRRTKLSFK